MPPVPVRLAINGFGRIGRAAFKIALQQPDLVEVVAINDLGELANLSYLLRYDSIYGRLGQTVTVEDTNLVVGGKPVKVLAERDPKKLPWQDLTIDVVIESTGVFTEEEQARQHIEAGAKYVIISAPTKSENVSTVLVGVNDQEVAGKDIISNASCTTNSAAPVAAVIDQAFGIESALLTTVHAYTATQSLIDGPATKEWSRGRAAGINIVPSTTGAAIAATKALPSLQGKFDGLALRVPVPVVSITDFTFLLKQETTVEKINDAFRAAVTDPKYRGVLAITEEPTVSSDFIGDPHSAIVDVALTMVVGRLAKVMAWYDNEWGYANRLIEQVIGLGTQPGR